MSPHQSAGQNHLCTQTSNHYKWQEIKLIEDSDNKNGLNVDNPCFCSAHKTIILPVVLYRCSRNYSPGLRKRHTWKLFEINMLGRILGDGAARAAEDSIMRSFMNIQLTSIRVIK
jgi:hypothetical protein